MKSLCPQTRKAALCVSLGELPVPGADRAWGLGAVTHRAGLGVGSLEPQPTLPPALLRGLKDERGQQTAGGSLSVMSPDGDTRELGAFPAEGLAPKEPLAAGSTLCPRKGGGGRVWET